MTIINPTAPSNPDRRPAHDEIPGLKKKLDVYSQVEIIHHIRRLNLEPVRLHLFKHGLITVDATSEAVLAICHRTRLGLKICTDAEKSESETYLRQKGIM